MSGAKEIRTKIKSIQNTQKITKAMEMVAASKMRKAQERMAATKPYSEKIWQVIGHMAHADPEYRHPYMVPRSEVRRVGYILVSTDRGLCGALNVNLFRKLLGEIQQYQNDGVEVDLAVIGQKGLGFFRRFGGRVVAEASNLGDHPRLEDVIGLIKTMLDAYEEHRIDRLFIARNVFVSTMVQRPEVDQLLPTPPAEDRELEYHWDYIYEPNAETLLTEILNRYIESVVYQAVVENVAAEMASRMIAMKSASDNAGDIIRDLKLDYNKARQAAITRELAEIVSGADALAS